MKENDRQWLTRDLLKTTEEYFRDKKIDESRLHAEILLAHVLRSNRMDLYLNHNRPVYRSELEEFRSLCRERLQGRPLQYITGEQIFYGYPFTVDERVLIPRPETELVLEHAVDRLTAEGAAKERSFSILDIGTGSGCLAVTFALKLPEAHITAVDLSKGALEIAGYNADRHGVSERVRFLQADVLHSGFPDGLGGNYDLIISNPPYIPEPEWTGLQSEVKEHEPKMALTTTDEFVFYRAITANASALLGSGGILCYELHADGAGKVSEIVRAGGLEGIEIHKDYAGLDRVLSGVWVG